MAKVSLRNNGYYRVSIGYESVNQKRKQKFFSLGKDRHVAQIIAHALEMEWEKEEKHFGGQKVWSEERIQSAYAHGAPATPSPIPAQTPSQATPVFQPLPFSPPPAEPTVVTLHLALDRYAAAVERRTTNKTDEGRKIRSRTYLKILCGMKSIKHHVADRPLKEIDSDALLEISNLFHSRPMKQLSDKIGTGKRRDKDHPLPTPRPISAMTVRNWLLNLSCALDWCIAAKLWTPEDTRWRSKLSFDEGATEKSPAEQIIAEQGAPTFTLEQLKIVYQKALPWGRFLILGGISLGWTQAEFATMMRNQLITENGETYIVKSRVKTNVVGKWWVNPELAAMFRHYIGKTPANQGNLALLTDKGMPLIHERCDAIKCTWDRLKAKLPADIPHLPFKTLRKMAGQLVEDLSGSEELAQIMLAQKRVSVAAKHYVSIHRNIGAGKTQLGRLFDVQKEIYAVLKQHVLPEQSKVTAA